MTADLLDLKAGGGAGTRLRPAISVIQPGARLNYAVPEILAGAGLLRRLYTDVHAEHWWMRAIGALLPRQPSEIKRLLGRRLPQGLPAALVEDAPVTVLATRALERAGLLPAADRSASRALLRRIEAEVLPGDIVYTVLVNEDVEVMRRLKARGVKIVHECMMSPDIGLWLAEERALFPGIEPAADIEAIAAGRTSDRAKYAVADLVLVPSLHVREAVIGMGCAPDKVTVVPYGLDPARFSAPPRPVPGRVLFVGKATLLKGAHYVAAAARAMAARRPDISVRMVGRAGEAALAHDAFLGPSYIGQVPRARMSEEYAQADLFVLPSLSEGMALSHLEAMAAGLPVIATPNCGSVVRDGIDGFIVPVRDWEALAMRIEEIVSDRALRDWMSRNARQRAQEFSLARYGERLVATLAPLLDA
jgi:glycosyltransferase involved in cell wall biosynthesis